MHEKNIFYSLSYLKYSNVAIISFNKSPSHVAGKTTLGHGNTDINIQGPGVTAQHCYIENVGGAITLYPCGNQCSLDGLAVTKPVRLTQGKQRAHRTHYPSICSIYVE